MNRAHIPYETKYFAATNYGIIIMAKFTVHGASGL
jgi:hypothetical protein